MHAYMYNIHVHIITTPLVDIFKVGRNFSRLIVCYQSPNLRGYHPIACFNPYRYLAMTTWGGTCTCTSKLRWGLNLLTYVRVDSRTTNPSIRIYMHVDSSLNCTRATQIFPFMHMYVYVAQIWGKLYTLDWHVWLCMCVGGGRIMT